MAPTPGRARTNWGRLLERARGPKHRGEDDARHGDHETDDPGSDVLRPHDRCDGDADPDDPAGGDHPDERRLEVGARPRTAVEERDGRGSEVAPPAALRTGLWLLPQRVVAHVSHWAAPGSARWPARRVAARGCARPRR